MSSHGILHQSSCAYTPQQNGVAERKNRHIVETTLTLLLHHNVLQCFWGDAILAACYLINRMPSSVLHYQILYFVLLPNQPFFCLPPRVFGCVCFVHIITHGQDRLSAKATKCVFLGYSRLQRGYRCYSLNINRYFIFADITFFKDSPFFSFAACPYVSDVLSIPLVLPSLDFPSPPTDVVTRPLQVYTHRPRPPIGPLVKSSSMPQSSPAPVPQPSDDLLPFRKVPALLLTHIMFVIFSAFVVYLYPTLPLFPSCLLFLPLKALARLSFIWVGKQWLRK